MKPETQSLQGTQFVEFLKGQGLKWCAVNREAPDMTFEEHYSERVSSWPVNLFPVEYMKEVLFTVFLENDGYIKIADRDQFIKKAGIEKEMEHCPEWVSRTFVFKGVFFKNPPIMKAYESLWEFSDIRKATQETHPFYKKLTKEYRLKKAFAPAEADSFLIKSAFKQNREFVKQLNQKDTFRRLTQDILNQFHQQVEQTARDFKIP